MYIKQFERLVPITENDGYLVLNQDGKTGRSTKPLSEIISDAGGGSSSSTMLVTARWKETEQCYYLDKRFSELVDAINQDIVPVLRVIKNGNKSFYNLTSYNDTEFVFKAPVEYGTDEGTNVFSPIFKYTNTDFIDVSTTLGIPQFETMEIG